MIPWCRDDAERALGEIATASGRITARFTELLNSYHGAARAPEYWDLIGGEWLLHFSHVVYAAYREVLGAPTCAEAEVPVPVFADHREFLGAAVGDARFGAALRAHVEAFLRTPVTCKWAYPSNAKVIGASSGSLRARVKGITKRIALNGLSNPRAPFVFCHPYIIGARREWLSSLWKWSDWARQDNFDYPIGVAAAIDADWRCRRAEEVSGATYCDAVLALMPLYLPTVYLEGFAAYRTRARALGLPRPRALYTANSLHGHMLFKVLAADWRDEGTQILDHQHGGGYGIDRIHPIEDYETRVADRFYTMGWSDSPKQVPLPNASVRLRSNYSCHAKRILLVCINFPDNVYRIHFHPMPGTVDSMVTQTVAFVGRMRNSGDFAIRPFPHDYGRNFLDQLRRTGTAFVVDDTDLSGPESYARSALVVHNYLGTSWLETLAMNIPTVCFYDADTYAFRGSAQPFIDRLAAVGILHTSAESAATHVGIVATDPWGWWCGADVQAARSVFVERYANFSPNWATLWETELRRWIE